MKAPQHCLSNAGKLKFFQTADPYAKYRCSASTVKVTARAASPPLSSSSCSCTIYGSAFSPGDVHYLVVCDSMGRICVWDILLGSSTSKTINDGDTRSGRDMLQTKGIGSKPILCVHASRDGTRNNTSFGGISDTNTLYDVKFIHPSSNETMLVVSGDPGVLVYRWADFEAAISEALDKKLSSATATTVEIKPITTFEPHPSPVTALGETIEINATSYDKSDNLLYAAAGDSFGCYQWDLTTERLMGTFGGYNRFGTGHRDYLHDVKCISEIGSKYVITGGEDGQMVHSSSNAPQGLLGWKGEKIN
eukprot:scaffold6361_cov193-Alexandrium_tamarense.AAC.5